MSRRLQLEVWQLILAAVVVCLIAAITIINWQSIVDFFGNTERLKQYVVSAGVWGPLTFIVVQSLQIIITPIPGQVVGLIAGALFGPWLGTLYTIIGAAIGFTTVFVLAKTLGRPFVEKFVKPKDLKKFDGITKRAGPLVLFLIFLLPGFPDDIICYLAGLSGLRISTLVWVSLAGRLPGYILTNFVGAGVGHANGPLIAVLGTAAGLALLLAYLKRKQIRAWVDHLLAGDDDEIGD